MRIEYHRTLIADGVRNDAFHAALKAVIQPGKTIVADIGAGTGLLGLIAAKLGAKQVFLFETAEVAAVAAKTIKANRAKQCVLIPCHSTEFDDTLQADVIVSETLGNYAFEENIIATIADSRRRFLKPGGVIIPRTLTQFAAPVVARRIHDELSAWDRVGHGLDFSIPKAMSFNNAYVRALRPDELLGAVAWDTIDFAHDDRSTRKGEARWVLKRGVDIYGFAVWWRADLGSGVSLSTAPDAPKTHWEQLYFPLLDPIAAKSGETVEASFRSGSSEKSGTHLAWAAAHFDSKGRRIARQSMDLDKGYLP
jgi:type I protein arginine methyltransferase